MKLLNGQEIAGFKKEQQAKAVRRLRQQYGVVPKLAIVQTKDDPVIDTYVKLKKKYGHDILVEVEIYHVVQDGVYELLDSLNHDASVHGVIVQLPLERPEETDAICDVVTPEKDVDALGKRAVYDPATPMAIMWLLAGYGVELQGKKVVLVGKGKLVGAPLERILKSSGIAVTVIDRTTENIHIVIEDADVIITATGSPAILNAQMIPPNCVVVDAGVAVESGRKIGDLDPDVYERTDLTITPVKGGVGPLTVCALFENVIRSAEAVALAQKNQADSADSAGKTEQQQTE